MSNIQFSRVGKVGYITLDRPKALNSLTHEMIRDIHAALRQHEQDDQVELIILRSSAERAFCAGGDMKATRLMAIDKQWDELNRFFAEEYALNLHIGQCAKTYISMINGVAMGGGLGLSVHGDVVVVSETAKLAMPETAIGFFPDVGGTHFLSSLPYDSGLWLALTGMPVIGTQAVSVGLATHCVPQSEWESLYSAFEELGQHAVDKALPLASKNPNDGASQNEFTATLKQRQEWFSEPDQESLLAVLASNAESNADAQQLLARLHKMSPYAMGLTRKLLAEAQGHKLVTCLKRELAAAREAVQHPDFIEGIRAVLVDKDSPVWSERG